MKKEIDNLSWDDACTIHSTFLRGKQGDIKVLVREYLRKEKLSVLDALVLVEKKKSSQPKTMF